MSILLFAFEIGWDQIRNFDKGFWDILELFASVC